MTPLLHALIGLLVGLPAAAAAAVMGPALADRPWSERAVGRVSLAAALGGLLGSGLLAAAWALGGDRRLTPGTWYGEQEHGLALVFSLDGLAAGASLVCSLVVLLTLRMSGTYLHRDPGYPRFFATTLVAAACLQLVALAGSPDLLFFGWELLGLCSFLLIAWFPERAGAARRALHAAFAYRAADLGLLVLLLLAHHAGHPPALGVGAAALPGGLATAAGLLLLATAAGKAGLAPFGAWLPRAVEGPTPSSAMFYASLSVSAGPWLLLRAWPLYADDGLARGALVVLGLTAAWIAARAARARPDAKGAIVLAGSAQLGLVVAEIGLGLHTLAALHLAGNAGLRFWQLTRAPGAIRRDQERDRVGAPARPEPTLLEDRRWALDAHLGGQEALADALARVTLRAAAALDALSRRAERAAVGGRDEAAP